MQEKKERELFQKTLAGKYFSKHEIAPQAVKPLFRKDTVNPSGTWEPMIEDDRL